jgi:hypothetical protein
MFTQHFGHGEKTAEQIRTERLAAFDADAKKSKLPEEQVKFLRDHLEHELDTAATLVQKNMRPGEQVRYNDLDRLSEDYQAALEHRAAYRESGPVLNYTQMKLEREGSLTGISADQD